MGAAKLLLVAAVLAVCSASASAALLDYFFPTVIAEHYQFAPTKEGYRFNFEEPNGSKRDEMGVILNPDTDKEEFVVMGTYSYVDEKTDIETITMYTADKEGYKARYMLKNRKLSPGALKTAAG